MQKKTHTNGPNNANHVVWARFPRRNLTVVFLWVNNINNSYKDRKSVV